MSYNVNQYGKSIGSPGLVQRNEPSSIASKSLKNAIDANGGFLCFGRYGEDDKAYTVNDGAAAAEARTVDITPTEVTAAIGSVVLYKGGVSVSTAATTAGSTVATLLDDLVANYADPLYTAADGATKMTLTAVIEGTDANDDEFTVNAGTSGFTFAVAVTNAGVDFNPGSVFIGIATLNTTRSTTQEDDMVGVMSKGTIMVQVSEDVLSEKPVYYDASYGISSNAGGTLIPNAKFVTSALGTELAYIKLNIA